MQSYSWTYERATRYNLLGPAVSIAINSKMTASDMR